MKINAIVIHCFMVVVLMFSTNVVQAQEKQGTVSHVVLVWLNESGNVELRKRFIAASSAFDKLPGVINRHVGVVIPSDRVTVDDTFDVAVTVTLKDKAALKAYMNHPEHKKVLEEKLKPLVNRVVVYDFESIQ